MEPSSIFPCLFIFSKCNRQDIDVFIVKVQSAQLLAIFLFRKPVKSWPWMCVKRPKLGGKMPHVLP